MKTFNPKTPVAGVYKMPEATYHALPLLNATSMKDASRSLQHFWANWAGNPNRAEREDKAAFIFGRAVHCAVLEPERFTAEYAALPEGTNLRTNDGKALKASLEARGKTILKAEEMATISAMVASLKADAYGSHIFAKGESEVTLIWQDAETGLWCKARADFINDTYVADLKTTTDASEDGFARAIHQYGYYLQAAFYMMGCHALKLEKKAFFFQAIEKEAPYATATHFLDKDYIDAGLKHSRLLMGQIATHLDAMKKGERLPGYAEKPIRHVLPQWIENKIAALEIDTAA